MDSIMLHHLSLVGDRKVREQWAGFRPVSKLHRSGFHSWHLLGAHHFKFFSSWKASSIQWIGQQYSVLFTERVRPKKFVNFLRTSPFHTCGHVRVCGELSSLFRTISCIWQACLICSFPFNFVFDKVMEEASGDLQIGSVKRANSENRNLNYGDDFACFFEFSKHVQRTLDRLMRAVASFNMCSAPSKRKVHLQEWMSAAWESILSEPFHLLWLVMVVGQ